MIVKICGITTLEDALLAVDNGADLLGFNFYPPSPRYVTPGAAAQIHLALLNHGYTVGTVGVFVNTPAAKIRDILDECGLESAQLAGDETVNDLVDLGGRAFKSIRPRDSVEARLLADKYACLQTAPDFLLDARVAGQYGGTGRTADWEIARSLSLQYSLLLAGGLTPDNLAQALERVNPWGVDVASGVETRPGQKDSTKLVEFFRIANRFVEGAGR